MKIVCPSCGVSGSVQDSFSGRKIRCPKCGEIFRCGTEGEPQEEVGADAGQQPEAEDVLQQAKGAGQAGQDEQPSDGTAIEDDEQLEAPLLNSSSTGESPITAPDILMTEEPPLSADSPRQTPESFTLGGALSRSWELTRGAKGQIWIGMLIMIAVLVALEVAARVLGMALGVNFVDVADVDPASLGSFIYECASSVFSTIITAGLMYMGVKWVREGQINWRDTFSGLPTALSLTIAMVLQFILMTLGFFLLILPGIYLTVGYSMSMPLIIDRKMSPWEAMETSRRAVHKVWWRMFGLMSIMMVIILLSAIPFGIGLIWTVPMAFVLTGLLYTILFPDFEKS